MKKLILVTLLILISFILYSENSNIYPEWIKDNPFLGHYLSVDELLRTDEIGRDFYETDPPIAPVRNIAEFEHMEGVLIRYPFGISYSIIAEMSEDVMVTTIVASTGQQTSVTNNYNSHGVNLDNCNFLIASSDSYWTRDYGPWYVVDGNNDVGIVNFPYNRPRPNDNDIPIEMADFLGIELYGMNLIHTGGNYMTDGMGISASSDLVFDENPSLTEEEVYQLVQDYLGIETYHAVPDPNNTYIEHIDCWGKFLDVDKILIRSVPSYHSQYDEIEETAAYFAAQISSYGTPYEVYRIYTPSNEPYTNSLILNNKVLVPITGSSWDDDALATYEEALPGYEILGFTGSWQSTDALHCRAKGVADRGMLYIYHIPVQGEIPAGNDINIQAEIIPYSGEPPYPDSLLIYYKVNDEEYNQILMTHIEDYTYSADIPAQEDGTEVGYFIHAADQSGRSANHPYIGAPDPHIFNTTYYPAIGVNIDSIENSQEINQTFEDSFELTNTGGGILEYSIRTVDTTGEERDLTGSTITCSAENYIPGETITWTFEVYNGSSDSEWIKDVFIDFPAGLTVNSATDFVGGSGGDMIFDGTTGENIQINWHGETGMGYGVLHDGQSAFADVNLTIDAEMTSSIELNYQIDGDLFGSEPHTVYGSITIAGLGDPAEWMSMYPISGNLSSGESETINYTLDSYELVPGIYTCDIIISGGLVEDYIIPVTINVTLSDADDDIVFYETKLQDIYPNPFNPETTIRFTTENTEKNTEIIIYNLKGQKVKQLVNEQLPAGQHSVIWNGTDNNGTKISSGIYIVRMESGKYTSLKKIILLK